MSVDGKLPVLRIYIAEHCWSCDEAIRLADEVRERFANLKLEVIDLDKGGDQNLDDVFSVPTYVLDGRTISFGNPAPGQLFARLAEALG